VKKATQLLAGLFVRNARDRAKKTEESKSELSTRKQSDSLKKINNEAYTTSLKAHLDSSELFRVWFDSHCKSSHSDHQENYPYTCYYNLVWLVALAGLFAPEFRYVI
jgi:hypothetical protein